MSSNPPPPPYAAPQVEAPAAIGDVTAVPKPKEPPVSYASLPNKGQLLVLCIARLGDPLAHSSIATYMFYQLKFFDPSKSNAEIAIQAGLIHAAKTGAQVCTGMIWGRMADAEWGGRKLTLSLGLISASIGVIGYGFSRSFAAAIAWQVVGGAFNANISMVRCVVAELNPEKRYRTRALLLLPLCATAGTLLGPLIGGLLSETTGNGLLRNYPYAPPNILIGGLLAIAALGVVFGLHETLESLKLHPERGISRRIWNKIRKPFAKEHDYAYSRLDEDLGSASSSPLLDTRTFANQIPEPEPRRVARLPFRKMWTFNVLCTMLAHFIIAGHLGTFGALWAVFLSTPVEEDLDKRQFPFGFGGGLGLLPRDVGIIMSILGAVGVVLQMAVYPRLQDRFGTILVWRGALFIYPVVYLLAPFPALAESINDPKVKTVMAMVLLGVVLFLFVCGRSGSTPATTLLINDCTPHPSVRATIHTTGAVVGQLARTIFPAIAFWIFGQGLRIGVVGVGFWCLSGLAVLACIASAWVKEGGNGTEIILPGDRNTSSEQPPPVQAQPRAQPQTQPPAQPQAQGQGQV